MQKGLFVITQDSADEHDPTTSCSQSLLATFVHEHCDMDVEPEVKQYQQQWMEGCPSAPSSNETSSLEFLPAL